MRLKLRLLGSVGGESRADLVVSIDDGATATELIAAFIEAEPWLAAVTQATPVLVIAADRAEPIALAPDEMVIGSGLRSGDAVALAPAGVWPVRTATTHAVTVTVAAGPDAPREYRLSPGRHLIGRTESASIRLDDPKVSARHAWLLADDSGRGSVELIDNGSANGTRIDGVTVDRGRLTGREVCSVGSSSLTVAPAPQQPTLERGGVIDFIRSPRLEPTFVGPKITAPRVPRPPDRAPFPLVTTLAPTLMIVAVVVLIGGLGSMVYFLLMPLLSIAAWWEQRRHDRRSWEGAVDRFHRGVAELSACLDAALVDEIAGREREQPGPDVLLEAARAHRSLLWTRRPEHHRFGTIRIGRSAAESRLRIDRERCVDGNPKSDRLERLLDDTIEDRRQLTDVPLNVDLDEVGNLALTGRRSSVEPVVRAIVVHLATLYAPAELVLVALDDDRRRWMWWLPHSDLLDAAIAGSDRRDRPFAEQALAALVDLVAHRRQGLAEHDLDRSPRLPRIVVIVDDSATLDRSTLIAISEVGPSVGVHVVWTASNVARVPAACRAFVDLDAGGSHSERGRLYRARLGLVDDGYPADEPPLLKVDFVADAVGADAAEWLARWLSPLVDAGATADVAAGLPHRLSLLDLMGHDLAECPHSVIERWATVDRSLSGLRCPIGRDVAGLRNLDLRSDGPHALVAGTTGSGKSEFLQTWIIAMAVTHPPEHFTVLLVDYKGGSAFSDCQHLPHCVGLVTDLTPHLVARALASLRAELRRRERLFEHLGVSDLAACEVQFPDDCPPSLVIVVDEFAALVSEVPDFVSGVVDVAQRGRSLGLHLVLATQRPAGVITDQVRANTNLRIALRMADIDDSSDVIGTDDAAHFDPRTPGRASMRLGSAPPAMVQVAYVGGVTERFARRDPIGVEHWDRTPASGSHGADHSDGGSVGVVQAHSLADLTRLVATVRAAAIDRPVPRRPWLDELADRYRLEALPTPRNDRELVIGVADRPGEQLQTTLVFDPERDGHLIVLGGGKSGKSTTLRTIVAAASWATIGGGPVHIYALQFGGRSLDGIAALPHVGAVVDGTDVEHVARTVAHLRMLVEHRQREFAVAAASSLPDFRAQTGRHDEPRLIVAVDGIGRFRDEFESGRLHAVYDQFISLIADGRAVGLHVVVTASRPAELGSVILSLIDRRVVLRLGDENDLTAIGVPIDFFDRATPPGRGWCDGDEVQVAVLGGDAAFVAEMDAFVDLRQQIVRHGAASARRIDPAPVAVQRADLVDQAASVGPGEIVVGIDVVAGEPIVVDPAGVLVVAGGRGSGVTTTVLGLVDELKARRDATCVLFGSARSVLASASPSPVVPRFTEVGAGSDAIGEATRRLLAAIRGGGIGRPRAHGPLVIVIENLDEHFDGAAEDLLVELVNVAHQAGVFMIVTADPASLSGSWPLQQAVRHARRAVMLRPDPLDIETVFGVTPARLLGNLPPGRGTYVDGDRAVTIQVAIGVSRPHSERP